MATRKHELYSVAETNEYGSCQSCHSFDNCDHLTDDTNTEGYETSVYYCTACQCYTSYIDTHHEYTYRFYPNEHADWYYYEMESEAG